jgi:hypothetical protein
MFWRNRQNIPDRRTQAGRHRLGPALPTTPLLTNRLGSIPVLYTSPARDPTQWIRPMVTMNPCPCGVAVAVVGGEATGDIVRRSMLSSRVSAVFALAL